MLNIGSCHPDCRRQCLTTPVVEAACWVSAFLPPSLPQAIPDHHVVEAAYWVSASLPPSLRRGFHGNRIAETAKSNQASLPTLLSSERMTFKWPFSLRETIVQAICSPLLLADYFNWAF